MKINLGSRKSRLALWQTRRIAELLEAAHPDLEVEIITMDTLGDQILDKPIPEIGGKGLFTAELEQALAADVVDFAIHSLKDLPTELPDGMAYVGSPKRANPTDSLVSHRWQNLDELPENAVIATGSVRRRAQLRARHPGFEFRELRGNIGTRLRKLQEFDFDAIIMASAALERLDLDLQADGVHVHQLDPKLYVPAVGQGAIGIEMRQGRDDIRALLKPIIDPETLAAVQAERVVMRRLEGGCSVPLGVYCTYDSDATEQPWSLHAWASNPDGNTVMERKSSGAAPQKMAEQLADELVAQGAGEILRPH